MPEDSIMPRPVNATPKDPDTDPQPDPGDKSKDARGGDVVPPKK